MKPQYLGIEALVNLIDEPNRAACSRLLHNNFHLFRLTQGATYNHQAWPGGYLDHVTEAMNVAVLLNPCLSAARALPFSLSDALLVVYLHDIEKPWKYELGIDGQLHHKPEMNTKALAQAFREQKLAEYGIALTAEHLNGIKYVEGELNDYTNTRRVMGPLAAFCHLCDVTSARLWFDYPAPSHDPWTGAARVHPV